MKSTVGWAQFKRRFIDRRTATWVPTKLQKWSPFKLPIITSYFLAAALGELASTQVDLWVTEQVSLEPVEILKEHDYELQYKGLGPS